MNNKEAALSYARAGIPVFPLHSPKFNIGPKAPNYGPGAECSCGRTVCTNVGKHPRTSKGLHAATTDTAQIEKWFTRWPDANVGIPTGKASGLVVVDADTSDAIEWVEAHNPDTLTVTSGNGRHYVFKAPSTMIRNSTSKLAEHVDVRGEGGYIVAPPSLHRNGKRYAWRGPLGSVRTGPIDDYEVRKYASDAPDWLIPDSTLTVELQTQDIPDTIAPGQRNDTLIRFAGMMRRGGMKAREIARALQEINECRCKPPLPQSELDAMARGIERYPTVELASVQANAIPELRLLTRDDLDSIKPPEWLIHDRLTANGLSVLYGPANVGKTFCALDMALSVATGTVYRQHDTTAHTVTQGHVVYLAAEGAYGIRPRVEAWEREHGTKAEDLYIMPTAINLQHADHVASFLQAIGTATDVPKLVVIDTLARCMTGADENSALDMGQVIHYIDKIREHIGGHVMIVHHSGKNSEYERGSTALRGAVDTMLRMYRNDDSTHTVHLQCTKQKDFAMWDNGLASNYKLKTVSLENGLRNGLDERVQLSSELSTDENSATESTNSCVLVEAETVDVAENKDSIL